MRDATAKIIPISKIVVFQSSRPVRDATISCIKGTIGGWFQSSRPVRDATCRIVQPPHIVISVSILASRERRDITPVCSNSMVTTFQSSRPVRDATASLSASPSETFVSILASRERRDMGCGVGDWLDDNVSILASRERRDIVHTQHSAAWDAFQSSRPVRDATESLLLCEQTFYKFQSSRPVRDATLIPL